MITDVGLFRLVMANKMMFGEIQGLVGLLMLISTLTNFCRCTHFQRKKDIL